ncbi:MAG: GNAT family N-acetyltransferase [Gemmatimonadetes bacterium]|nr:GNAT family N-acetyltransferase [Gemmatimonadota bacterium]
MTPKIARMELVLPRLVIRSWRPDDAPLMAPLADNYQIWRFVRDRFPHPYTVANAEAYIAEATAKDPECWFAITLDDRPIGAIGLIPGEDINRVTAEMGYWLGEPYWGHGYATEAARGFSDWVLANRDFVRLEGIVFSYHTASANVLQKAGFELESTKRRAAIKEGKVVDEHVFVRLRD